MIERVQDTNLMRIQTYGLAEFLLEIEELIQRGYKLDIENNDHYPQAIGHLFTTVMIPKVTTTEAKPKAEQAVEVPEELKALQAVVSQGQTPAKRGPKAKQA